MVLEVSTGNTPLVEFERGLMLVQGAGEHLVGGVPMTGSALELIPKLGLPPASASKRSCGENEERARNEPIDFHAKARVLHSNLRLF